MATDRHEYWAKRWREQKVSSTTPDRHEYWKKRWEEQKETSESVFRQVSSCGNSVRCRQL